MTTKLHPALSCHSKARLGNTNQQLLAALFPLFTIEAHTHVRRLTQTENWEENLWCCRPPQLMQILLQRAWGVTLFVNLLQLMLGIQDTQKTTKIYVVGGSPKRVCRMRTRTRHCLNPLQKWRKVVYWWDLLLLISWRTDSHGSGRGGSDNNCNEEDLYFEHCCSQHLTIEHTCNLLVVECLSTQNLYLKIFQW